MERISIPIPPFSIQVEDAVATIWEVIPITFPTGEKRYHVTLTINYRGIESRRFHLDVKSNEDLKNKLKIELTKLKFIYYGYGGDVLRKLMTT